MIMVFVDTKIASIVTGGREAPKAEGLWLQKEMDEQIVT